MNTDIPAALAAPFPADAIHWKPKPKTITNNRVLALPYITARSVMDRLDESVGVTNWQDEYRALPDGSVICVLRVRFGEEWIAKTDVGGMAEHMDTEDRFKSAFSDALKRAAVKFGVGRYLYDVAGQWADWDPQKKCITRIPTLPPDALPAPRQPQKPAEPKPEQRNGKPGVNGDGDGSGHATLDRHAALFLLKLATDKKGWQPGQLREHLRQRYSVDYVKDLTLTQAAELQTELSAG